MDFLNVVSELLRGDKSQVLLIGVVAYNVIQITMLSKKVNFLIEKMNEYCERIKIVETKLEGNGLKKRIEIIEARCEEVCLHAKK